MQYIIYQVTNNINGKIYIGSHKTKDINDNYMGSGKYLNRAIDKHGVENFSKEILFVYDNLKDMFAKEAELVDEDFLAETNTYNLKIGGFGGWDYVNVNNLNNTNKDIESIGKKISNRLKGRKVSDQRRQKLIDRHKRGELAHTYFGSKNKDLAYLLKAQSCKAKAKRKKTLARIHFQQGKNNSQYGTCWICHELFGNKKIKKALLPEYISQGWILGKLEKYNRIIQRAKKKRLKKDEFIHTRRCLAIEFRDQFLKLNYKSIRKFIRDGHYDKSHQTLIDLWKRYIPEFDPGYK